MTDPLLIETAERVLAASCTQEAIQAAEREGWAPDVWDRVAAMGLPWLSIPESAGGAGGDLSDALAVLRVAGRHAAPIPLAETSVLAGWLLAGAGQTAGSGPATLVPGRAEDSVRLDGHALAGTAHRVPWARSVERIVVLIESDGRWWVAAMPSSTVRVQRRANLAGEARDTVTFDGSTPAQIAPAATGVDAPALRYRGALTRVMLMAGALERMSRMTIAYCSERAQFGRPVARFQAVQQHLVTLAQEAAIVGMAAEAAAREGGRFEIAAAKLLANQAATTATRAAHQAHGAMGMTQEYPLHHLSRRLWAWRSEYGDDHFWSTRLGEAVVGAGADRLYPAITGGSSALTV